MGLIRMGPPFDLLKILSTSFGIENFVETGTYLGKTALEAAENIQHVFTIEYSQEIYEKTKLELETHHNITALWGDSREKLKRLSAQVKGPCIFWLDAHWSGGSTYGKDDECPLIEEIKIIQTFSEDSFILIDDARLFTSPPPPPHKIEQWPDLPEIVDALRLLYPNPYIVILEDVIIAVPSYAKPIVSHYCQQVNQAAWSKQNQKSFLDKIYRSYAGFVRRVKA
jgi:hypothetical protein